MSRPDDSQEQTLGPLDLGGGRSAVFTFDDGPTQSGQDVNYANRTQSAAPSHGIGGATRGGENLEYFKDGAPIEDKDIFNSIDRVLGVMRQKNSLATDKIKEQIDEQYAKISGRSAEDAREWATQVRNSLQTGVRLSAERENAFAASAKILDNLGEAPIPTFADLEASGGAATYDGRPMKAADLDNKAFRDKIRRGDNISAIDNRQFSRELIQVVEATKADVATEMVSNQDKLEHLLNGNILSQQQEEELEAYTKVQKNRMNNFVKDVGDWMMNGKDPKTLGGIYGEAHKKLAKNIDTDLSLSDNLSNPFEQLAQDPSSPVTQAEKSLLIDQDQKETDAHKSHKKQQQDKLKQQNEAFYNKLENQAQTEKDGRLGFAFRVFLMANPFGLSIGLLGPIVDILSNVTTLNEVVTFIPDLMGDLLGEVGSAIKEGWREITDTIPPLEVASDGVEAAGQGIGDGAEIVGEGINTGLGGAPERVIEFAGDVADVGQGIINAPDRILQAFGKSPIGQIIGNMEPVLTGPLADLALAAGSAVYQANESRKKAEARDKLRAEGEELANFTSGFKKVQNDRRVAHIKKFAEKNAPFIYEDRYTERELGDNVLPEFMDLLEDADKENLAKIMASKSRKPVSADGLESYLRNNLGDKNVRDLLFAARRNMRMVTEGHVDEIMDELSPEALEGLSLSVQDIRRKAGYASAKEDILQGDDLKEYLKDNLSNPALQDRLREMRDDLGIDPDINQLKKNFESIQNYEAMMQQNAAQIQDEQMLVVGSLYKERGYGSGRSLPDIRKDMIEDYTQELLDHKNYARKSPQIEEKIPEDEVLIDRPHRADDVAMVGGPALQDENANAREAGLDDMDPNDLPNLSGSANIRDKGSVDAGNVDPDISASATIRDVPQKDLDYIQQIIKERREFAAGVGSDAAAASPLNLANTPSTGMVRS